MLESRQPITQAVQVKPDGRHARQHSVDCDQRDIHGHYHRDADKGKRRRRGRKDSAQDKIDDRVADQDTKETLAVEIPTSLVVLDELVERQGG